MIDSLHLYDQLLQFTLFQGMSRSELLQLAGNTRFGFQKIQAGKWVVHEGDSCNQFHFLVGGTVSVLTQSDAHTYCVMESLQAPWLMEPASLFGLTTRYRHTVQAQTDAHFITLSKDEVLRLLDDFLIIRLNLLNILSTQVQRGSHRPWRTVPVTLYDRVVRFFVDHVAYPAGRKEFRILMRQLAVEVGATRLNVSRVLNQMEQRGLVELRRGSIVIPLLEHLLMT
jgi:CRP-like cAMP-binding protein